MTDTVEDLADLLPGYEIGAELGRGAFGVVLAGRHRQLGRHVAIKLLSRAFSESPDVRHRFSAEARILGLFDHPNIVPVFDYVEQGGLCALVMELLPAGTVRHRLHRGLGAKAACAIGLAACSALDYAHRRGVLHRDVKPDNLLFTADGLVKMTDFGIARVVGGQTVTRVGETVGTPLYMAPEQCSDQALGPATDVYATGLMLYELLAGHHPFAGASDALSTMYRQIHDVAPPVNVANHAVPEAFSPVIMRAMAKDPAARYPSAQALGAAVAEAAVLAWGEAWQSGEAAGIMSRGPVDSAGEWLSARQAEPAAPPVPPLQPTVLWSGTPPEVAANPAVGDLSGGDGEQPPEGVWPPAAAPPPPPRWPPEPPSGWPPAAAPPPPPGWPPESPSGWPPESPSHWPPEPPFEQSAWSPDDAWSPDPLPGGFEATDVAWPDHASWAAWGYPSGAPNPTEVLASPSAADNRHDAAWAGAAAGEADGGGSDLYDAYESPAWPPPAPHRGRTVAIAVTVVVACIAVIAAVLLTTRKPAPTPAAKSPTGQSPAQVAAAVNQLIRQSSSARSQVVDTVASIENCSANAPAAASSLNTAIGTRQQVVRSLQALPVGELPNGVALRSALTTALDDSIAADRSFRTWLDGITANGGCSGHAPTDANFLAGERSSSAADTAKRTFASLWNPVATTYGLPKVTSTTI